MEIANSPDRRADGLTSGSIYTTILHLMGHYIPISELYLLGTCSYLESDTVSHRDIADKTIMGPCPLAGG